MSRFGGTKKFRGGEVRFSEHRVMEYDMSEVWIANPDDDVDFEFAMTKCEIEGTAGGRFTFHIKGEHGEEVIARAKEFECSDEFIGLIRNAKCWGVHWVRFNP